MDLKKTGEFIARKRKERKLTQIQLAEKLCVSEKTISKWECGYGFPDTSLMLPLCEALDISANELLSGKDLDDKEYKQEAENNLIRLRASEEHNAKFLLTLEFVMVFSALVLAIGFIFLAALADVHYVVKIISFIFSLAVLIFVCIFALRIEQTAGFYECRHCGNKYVPKYKSVLMAMHVGTTRYMKCPVCHKHSWQKKTLK